MPHVKLQGKLPLARKDAVKWMILDARRKSNQPLRRRNGQHALIRHKIPQLFDKYNQ